MTSFLERALPLLAHNFSLIPLQPRDKNPLPGFGVTKKTRDRQTIESWSEANPEANVGVVADENFLILDADNLEHCVELLKNEGVTIPATFTVQSSPGRAHFYFRQTDETRKSNNIYLPGVFELRLRDAYVVGPRSIHPKTGQLYTITDAREPVELPTKLLHALHWLKGEKRKELRKKSPVEFNQELASMGVGDGRHPFLLSEAGRLWTTGKTVEPLYEELQAINRQFAVPHSDQHVADIANTAEEKWEQYEPGYSIRLNWGNGTNATNGNGKKETDGNVDPDSWRNLFHTYEEAVNAPPLRFAIRGFLQEDGITLIGGLAGHSKTLIMLNMAKVLLEGGCLFGHEPFEVTRNSARVVYLVPESGLGPFVHRLRLFRLLPFVQSGQFLFRTLSAKEDVTLSDPRILRAVEGADVFLDTAVRFLPGDENSATDQKEFAKTLFRLQAAGARTITGAHHAPKNFESKDTMTLENALRGSGDIGAMLATCWVVRQTDKATNTVHVRNVKPRDFEPCEPFEIEGRPHIDQSGQFRMSKLPGMAGKLMIKLSHKENQQAEAKVMRQAGSTHKEIAEWLNISVPTVERWQRAGVLGPDPSKSDGPSKEA
jgi:hypothetical protein